MSQINRIVSLDRAYHPVSHYDSPDDVLRDAALSSAEKRVILSSWASDMYAVESNPALREVPGIAEPMRLADILAALRHLDSEDDPTPPGGAVIRLAPRRIVTNAIARTPDRAASQPRRALAAARR